MASAFFFSFFSPNDSSAAAEADIRLTLPILSPGEETSRSEPTEERRLFDRPLYFLSTDVEPSKARSKSDGFFAEVRSFRNRKKTQKQSDIKLTRMESEAELSPCSHRGRQSLRRKGVRNGIKNKIKKIQTAAAKRVKRESKSATCFL